MPSTHMCVIMLNQHACVVHARSTSYTWHTVRSRSRWKPRPGVRRTLPRRPGKSLGFFRPLGNGRGLEQRRVDLEQQVLEP